MRDITLEDTVYFNFTTRAITGVPTTLAGTPVLSVLEENNATPITAGVSVAVDRASVTGLNQATIVATAANGYEAGKGYCVYISTGTVNSVSAVGEVVAEFTIQANPVNWAKVTSPTTAVDLSATDIQLCDTVETNTDMRGTDSAATAAELAKVPKSDGTASWNATALAAINTEADAAISDAALATAAALATVDSNVDAILVDTADLQANQGNWLTATAFSTHSAADVAALLNDVSTAEVLTQVNAALDTAIAELGVAAPTATPTLRTGLMLLYMMARNKLVVQTSGVDAIEVYNDAGTKIAAKAISDDGSDYTENEMA